MEANETTDLAKSEPGELQVAPPSPLVTILELCTTGKMDADNLSKVLDVYERNEKIQAKKAYVVAMAAFKADPPKIIKDKDNKQYGSRYAGLANVTDTINAKLSEHGLSSSWKTDQKENGWPEVTCVITHAQGHSESTKLAAPPDDSGSKNPIQKIKSTITYLEQITLLALTGLATHDQDDDGNGANDGAKGPPEPTDEEQTALDAMCDAMLDSVPDGLTLDRERVKIVVHAKWKNYPNCDAESRRGTKSLIDLLNRDNSWDTVCAKP